MGQQQLLTLVLSAMIVGAAILLGLSQFSQERKGDRHKNDMQQYLLTAAGRAQAWYRQPVEMGGGGRSFAQITWKNINMGASTETAVFTMSIKQQTSFLLTGISREDSTIIIKYLVSADSVTAVP